VIRNTLEPLHSTVALARLRKLGYEAPATSVSALASNEQRKSEIEQEISRAWELLLQYEDSFSNIELLDLKKYLSKLDSVASDPSAEHVTKRTVSLDRPTESYYLHEQQWLHRVERAYDLYSQRIDYDVGRVTEAVAEASKVLKQAAAVDASLQEYRHRHGAYFDAERMAEAVTEAREADYDAERVDQAVAEARNALKQSNAPLNKIPPKVFRAIHNYLHWIEELTRQRSKVEIQIHTLEKDTDRARSNIFEESDPD
jgi:hypothetical protein